ncbi:MAG: LacI family DNA-binding transcriptional regulator [Pseudomonadota bacterium]
MKPTVHDIAREAGVSLATVDRVLNARPGVRTATVERVQAAIERLGYVRDLSAANLARQRLYRFLFLLPDSGGQFFTDLKAAIREVSTGALAHRTELKTLLVSNRDPAALIKALRSLDPNDLDGVAIMARETPLVRDTIARLKAAGVAVVTLVSDQPNADRDHFVGFDNVAAGRTAGQLVGRFIGTSPGKVGVVITSTQSRDMIDRRRGFDAILQREFPNLDALPSVEAHDDAGTTERVARHLLAAHPDLLGLYSAGASIAGIHAALRDHAGPKPVVIDHELTPNSRIRLEDGTLDAVISQNTGHLARSAVRVLRARVDGAEIIPSQERIRIDIITKENLP